VSHWNCPGSNCPGFSLITALVSKCLETGAEVSQSVLMPKCLVAEVSGNQQSTVIQKRAFLFFTITLAKISTNFLPAR